MKKLFLSGIITVAILAVTGVIFNACKKDGESLDHSGKMHKSGFEDLLAFEYYTPSEGTMKEKFLSMTNYMENPSEYSMPNMELKEAIWFLEAYFNMGICYKQEYSCKDDNLKKTYQFTVPFEGMWGDDVFLNGEILQAEYSAILASIKSNILPEYAVNIGNVYVRSVNSSQQKIELGIDLFYGHKSGDEVTEFEPIFFRYKKMVGPSTYMESYPNDGPEPANILFSDTCDPCMTAILNQARTSLAPVGIVEVDDIKCDHLTYAFIMHVETLHDFIPAQPKGSYVSHGKNYRDYIWTNLVPQVPAGYFPYKASAEWDTYTIDPVHHSRLGFEIKLICSNYVDPATLCMQ
jgi:hypothetical protein